MNESAASRRDAMLVEKIQNIRGASCKDAPLFQRQEVNVECRSKEWLKDKRAKGNDRVPLRDTDRLLSVMNFLFTDSLDRINLLF